MNFFAYLIYFGAVILPWLMVLGLFVVLAFRWREVRVWRWVFLSLFSALSAWFLVSLFKYNFPSPRPFEVLDNFKPLFATGKGDAFPSGHATFLGALAFSFFFSRPKLGFLFVFGAILVALCRVLAFVHWPIDVLVGLLFGFIFSLILHLFLVKYWHYE